MQIVINDDYGGFGLSDKAVEFITKAKGMNIYFYEQDQTDGKYVHETYRKVKNPNPKSFHISTVTKDFGDVVVLDNETICDEFYGAYLMIDTIARDDKDLIDAITTLGPAANGRFASLKIVNVPDEVVWQIGEYDGSEWVEEVHRTWR